MPWHREERFRRGKKVYHTDDPKRYRIAVTRSAIHYESQMDTGVFDTEVNMTPVDISGSRLAGPNITSAGFHFGYQDGRQRDQQKPRGSFGFGGRRGFEFLNMRPSSIGYLNWEDNGWQGVRDNPTLRTPTIKVSSKTIGINDDDPNLWTINAGANIDCGDIWTLPGAGRVHHDLEIWGGQIEPRFTINQAARTYFETDRNGRNIDPDSKAAFGVRIHLDLNGIASVEHGGKPINRLGDNIDVDLPLRFLDQLGRPLAHMGPGKIFVTDRGGTVDILKRVWFDGTDWWLFMGCNVAQMKQNLLRGDMVIDPPIAEEDITQNSDDATESTPYMYLSGYGANNRHYIGGNGQAYQSGWVFQTIPSDQGDTVNSATLEPVQAAAGTGTFDASIFGNDVDNAGTFTTANNNISGRTRTTASTALDETDFTGTGNRLSFDVQSQFQEVINRPSWANNNSFGLMMIATAGSGYRSMEDYAGGAADAADFNADVTSASSDIAAAIATTLTVAAELDAEGQLTSAQSLALTVAADLAAQGNLQAALSLLVSVVADLAASGELQAAIALQSAIVANVGAIGGLSVTAAGQLSVAAELAGQGNLQAAVALLTTVAADLQSAASNDLEATIAALLTVTPGVTASGELVAAIDLVASTVADLAAQGEVEAAVALVLSAAADLEASGQLAAAVALLITVTPDLGATGSLSSNVSLLLTMAAGLAAAGQLQSAIAVTMSVAANLGEADSDDIQAAISATFSVLAEASARGEVLAAPALLFSVVPNLGATGEFDVSVNTSFTVNANGTLVGELGVTVPTVSSVAANLLGSENIESTASVTSSVAAVLMARAGILATAATQLTVSATLVDGAARTMPNSVQNLIVSLFNAVQSFTVSLTNSDQTLLSGGVNSDGNLNG